MARELVEAASPSKTPQFPTTPSVEAWRAMSREAQERFQIKVNEMLSEAFMMSEGRPHKRAKAQAVDALNLHYKTIGRRIYIAEEMSVLYPGEQGFSPDVLAVLDVDEPEDDERLSWVVANEGKGIDLAIEVLHRGDRNKDLVENVERFARLGITEYFVYDRRRQQIHGYRLPSADAGRYQRILPQLGHLRSNVLGLDLAILDGTLRFFSGEATLPISADLIRRLQGMTESLSAKADEAEAQREEAEAQREKAEAQREKALVDGLREGLFALLDARAIPCSDEARARIDACDDPDTLRRVLSRAKVAASADELFSD